MKVYQNIVRKIILLVLLGSYTAGIIKPSFPLFSDVLAHSWDCFDHISTIHFENGEYHVHGELKKEGKKSKDSKTCMSENKHLDIHVLETNFYHFQPIYFVEKHFYQCTKTPIEAVFQLAIPPPRILFILS